MNHLASEIYYSRFLFIWFFFRNAYKHKNFLQKKSKKTLVLATFWPLGYPSFLNHLLLIIAHITGLDWHKLYFKILTLKKCTIQYIYPSKSSHYHFFTQKSTPLLHYSYNHQFLLLYYKKYLVFLFSAWSTRIASFYL